MFRSNELDRQPQAVWFSDRRQSNAENVIDTRVDGAMVRIHT